MIGLQTAKGSKGDPGLPNSLSIGEVITGLPNSNASASITGTSPNQSLSLVIPRGIQGIQGIQGPPGIIGEQNQPILITGLTQDSPALEGATFPKTLTLLILNKLTTINKLIGLLNTQASGSAIFSIQFGLTTFTTITGLSNLNCSTTTLPDQSAAGNNVIPAGQRLRISFASITGIINISFSLILTEAS